MEKYKVFDGEDESDDDGKYAQYNWMYPGEVVVAATCRLIRDPSKKFPFLVSDLPVVVLSVQGEVVEPLAEMVHINQDDGNILEVPKYKNRGYRNFDWNYQWETV